MFYKETNFKESPIGRIPKEWEVVRLGDVLEEEPINGIYKERSHYGKGNAYIVQLLDLYNSQMRLNCENLEKIELTEGEIKLYLVKNGDIIVNRVSKQPEGVGKAVLAYVGNKTVVFESNMFRLRLDPNLLNQEYFVFYSQSNLYITQMRKMARITNQASINQKDLRNVIVPLPPFPEQQKIAKILSTVDKKLELERKRKEKLERIKKGLMNDLLTGRRRVKV